MPAPVAPLSVSDSDRRQLQQWASAYGTPQQVALRCRIVLVAADGQSDNAIAQQLESNRPTVRLWCARFAQKGCRVYGGGSQSGTESHLWPEKIRQVIDTTLQSKPKGRTHSSCRSMAQRLGVSKSTVSNIWRSHNLKPHRVKTLSSRAIRIFWRN